MSNPMKKQRQESDNLQGPSVSRFASEIRHLWRRTSANNLKETLKLGCTIRDARRFLPHGDWTNLWRLHDMPFSMRHANRMIVISGLEEINGTCMSRLPQSFNALYCLGLLDLFQLESLIKEGIVHPHLTQKEARELVAQYNGEKPVSKDPKDSDFRKRVEHLCKCVRANMENAEAEYAWARGKLLSLAEQMEVAAGVRFTTTEGQDALGLEDFE